MPHVAVRPTKRSLLEQVTNMLLCLDFDEPPEGLIKLTVPELKQVARWCATSMFEASDNPVRARCAPKCLRRLLPADHYLQRWRVPKRRR